MKKKLSWILLLVMLVNLFSQTIFQGEVYAAELEPTIVRVNVKEIVEVVGDEPKTSYAIVFTGLLLSGVDAIIVQDSSGKMLNILSGFASVDSTQIQYRPDESSLESIFGGTGDLRFTPVVGATQYPADPGVTFTIPATPVMKIEKINEQPPGSWPINVVKGITSAIQFQGTNFNQAAYTLTIAEEGALGNQVPYTVNAEKNLITISDTSMIDAGPNKNLTFEHKASSNVTISYVVKNALNITNPLEIGKAEISPMRGTAGTIVRIRAEKNDAQLTDPGVKVYIGGVLAPRNISDFNPDGTFEYYVGSVKMKGIEVVVPKLATDGDKQLVIQNNVGSTYIHDEHFFYELSPGALLRIFGATPLKAFTNTEEIVTMNVSNIVAVNNIDHNSTIVGVSKGGDPGDYFQSGDDPKAFILKYQLADGTIIERKISVSIARRATIVDIPFPATGGTISDNTVIQVKTDKVELAGTYTITARTETIHYAIVGGNKVEKQYIVEEAPYSNQVPVTFTFEPDTATPVIDKITPNKGPHTKDIVATLTGQNFIVLEQSVVEGGTTVNYRHYPIVVIGNPSVGYKIMTKDSKTGESVVYFSSSPTVSNLNLLTPIPVDFEFTVLDNNNNIVNGQTYKTGTKIKFIIPAGLDEYSGAANVYVYNPTSTGEIGGQAMKENLFEYISATDVIQPIIDSVSPSQVAVGRNEQVVVKGQYFQPNAIVTVDGEVVNNPVIDVANGTITFNAPNGRAGKTYIQVINPDGGFASAPFEYIQTYTQPHIAKIIPNQAGKGSLIIIKGSGFTKANETGANDNFKIGTKVLINDQDVNKEVFDLTGAPVPFTNPFDATPTPIVGPDGQPIYTYGSNVAVVDSETIYVIVPDPKDPAKPFFMNEFLDVKVVNPDLGSHTLPKGFKFIDVVTSPKIDSITPELGDYRGGNIVEIQGENFNAGIKVYFGTQEAQVYRRSNNGKTLWAYVPAYAGDIGQNNQITVPVTVQNPNGGTDTKYDGYLYVNPGYDVSITSLTPNSGNTAGGDRILITGVNFRAKNFGKANQELPSVYFGGVKVPQENITFVLPPQNDYDEVETSALIIVEKTPPNPAGKVDVTVINFDGATANLKGGYEYRSKQPVISQVLPNSGSMLGGTEITIIGKEFVAEGIHVAFGNEKGSNDVLSGQAEVKLGDVIIRYDAYATNNISMYYKEATPGHELEGLINGKGPKVSTFPIVEEEEFIIVTIPWSQVSQETAQLADENIKIEVKDSHLVVTRRLGVVKRVIGGERIILLTPPADAVGEVNLTVYNYDGKSATSKFTYTSPFRAPIITKITPVSTETVSEINGVPYQPPIDIDVAISVPEGGSPLIIEGQNFRAGVKVFIGDVEAEIRSKSANDNELIIIVPKAVENTIGQYLRILVVNDDGGSTYGDIVPEGQTRNPYYFKYVPAGSKPTIISVTPDKGPTTGGTKVTIKGTNFKNEDTLGKPQVVQVYIGGIPVPQSDVTYIDPQTLEVVIPAGGRVGPQTVEVVNYDFGRAVGDNLFTYISQPSIDKNGVDPSVLLSNDTETEVTIKGKMFLPGAKVIIGGRLVLESDVTSGDTVTARGIRGVEGGVNRRVAVIGGMEAASVVVVDENTLKVKFNEGFDLQTNYIIVVNTDEGISEPYTDFEYRPPVPNKPMVLEGIPGPEASVGLIWSDSDKELLNKADRFEIYGKLASEKEFTFIGDTRDYQFTVQGLASATQYTFMVRAMNKYGGALEFAQVTVRTYSEREDQSLKDKQEAMDKVNEKERKEGKLEIINGTAVRTIGTAEIPNAVTPYVIDLTLSQYKNQSRFMISIPLTVVENLNRRITITDGIMEFTFLPRDFYTREAIAVPQANRNDAHVQIIIERLTGSKAEGMKTAVARNQIRASEIYDLEFQVQWGKNVEPIHNLIRSAELKLKYDANAYRNAKGKTLFLTEYQVSSHSFKKVADGQEISLMKKGCFTLMAQR